MGATLAEIGGRGHEQGLWRRLKSDQDQRAREELVRLYMPMARRMAGRYAGVVEPYDDLVQVASLGLLNAIDRFDGRRRRSRSPGTCRSRPTMSSRRSRRERTGGRWRWTDRLPASTARKHRPRSGSARSTVATSWSRSVSQWKWRCRASTHASGRCCDCASSRTCPSRRSPRGSALPDARRGASPTAPGSGGGHDRDADRPAPSAGRLPP
jgi:hypothetical protein